MAQSRTDGTPPDRERPSDDSLVRRGALALRDASLRFTGGSSLEDGQSYTISRLADVLGASRVFFATWSDTCYVGRSIVGATDAQQRAFRRRSLPTMPREATSAGDTVQISMIDGLNSTHPWLAEIAQADDMVLAVALWAGRHPTCVIGIVGLDDVDEDARIVIDSFLLMLMGATIAEMLLRQRNRAELRRGEALDTLVDELDDERRRISHEIHDGVLQSVSSIAHFLETLSASAESDSTRDVLERLRLEAQNSAITLRRIVNDFEPEQRVDESMSSQIKALTGRFTDLFDLYISVEIDDAVDDLPPTRAVLRVLRQALDNIVTHAEAGTVHVTATIDADNGLTLTIDDDGTGIENDHPWDLGVGLRSMTRLVDEHGGSLTVGAGTARGTCLSATFPSSGAALRRAADGATSTTSTTSTTSGDDDAIDAIRTATLALLDRGRRPTIGSVAESTGLSRRDLLARYMSAPSMIADAIDSLVDSIEHRWAAFGPINRTATLEARLDELLERRFRMERWGRPLRQTTLDVDPSSRFDDEVTTVFQPELARLDPAIRNNTGRLVAWLLRPRTIRSIIGDASVDPHVVRSTIHSVSEGLLRPES